MLYPHHLENGERFGARDPKFANAYIRKFDYRRYVLAPAGACFVCVVRIILAFSPFSHGGVSLDTPLREKTKKVPR